MVTIDGTTITMVRGDTAKIAIEITNANGDPYEIQNGDSIRFAAKKKYTDNAVLIQKDVDVEDLILILNPEDTKPLEMGASKGKYVYDIQITQADGTVDTFIRGTLILIEEVD